MGEGDHPTAEGAEAGPDTRDRQEVRHDSAVSTLRGLLNNLPHGETDFLFTLADSSPLMSSSSSSEMSS